MHAWSTPSILALAAVSCGAELRTQSDQKLRKTRAVATSVRGLKLLVHEALSY